MTNKEPSVTTITISGGQEIVEDLLNEQYKALDSGEARAALEEFNGANNVWNEDEFCATFSASHFDPPYVHVIRNVDRQLGSVLYVDSPRFYFSFQADTGSTNHDGTTP
jgi:hypothetical protein